jgi:conjugative coupling factor TraD (SXT/TOL subfamily)
MSLADRVGHTLVLGTTRVGKTRLAELLIAQDIRRGEVVIVFDPKGDADLLRRVYAEAKRAGREREFHMFHLGHPEISACYNPIGTFSRVTEVATRIAGQLPSEGQSATFKEFVWRFVNVMARALVALGRKPGYEQISRYAANVEPLLGDYFEHCLDRETGAAGWRGEVESMQIDKKSLNKGLQSRGLAAVTLTCFSRYLAMGLTVPAVVAHNQLESSPRQSTPCGVKALKAGDHKTDHFLNYSIGQERI